MIPPHLVVGTRAPRRSFHGHPGPRSAAASVADPAWHDSGRGLLDQIGLDIGRWVFQPIEWMEGLQLHCPLREGLSGDGVAPMQGIPPQESARRPGMVAVSSRVNAAGKSTSSQTKLSAWSHCLSTASDSQSDTLPWNPRPGANARIIAVASAFTRFSSVSSGATSVASTGPMSSSVRTVSLPDDAEVHTAPVSHPALGEFPFSGPRPILLVASNKTNAGERSAVVD